jgi:hypothetical protein
VIPELYNGRNRPFYMYGYEGSLETRPRRSVLTVPTAEQETGNLSGLLRLDSLARPSPRYHFDVTSVN